MNNFKHVPKINFKKLQRKDSSNGRSYVTPEGNEYPSVTTVLSKTGDKTWLENWKKRIGEEEAKKIVNKANKRGTAVHKIIEDYLNNDIKYKRNIMPMDLASFNSIKQILDDNIGLIAGLEVPLYSNILETAGTVDCVAKWSGKWSIVDFKTSKKIKSKEYITNYFLQESAYAFMFEELTGKKIPQIVTVITVDNNMPQVFVEEAENYIDEFKKRREMLNQGD